MFGAYILHTTSPVFNISFSKEISNASNVLDSPLSSIDLVPKETIDNCFT